MDVRSTPEWCVRAANKVYEPKKVRHYIPIVPPSTAKGGDDVDYEQADQDDDGLARIVVDVSAVQTEGIPHPAGNPLEQYEKLKLKQQEQMQALLLQQTEVSAEDQKPESARRPLPLACAHTSSEADQLLFNPDTIPQLAEQQTELLAQQAAAAARQEAELAEAQSDLFKRQEAHRARQLEIERGIQHVTHQQQQQLAETEVLVEAQRAYLESVPQQHEVFGEGCGMQCDSGRRSRPLALATDAPDVGGGCFSAEI